MRRSKFIHPVVAYVWPVDHGEPLNVSADDFWPNRSITDGHCVIDWNKIPVWRELPDGQGWAPVMPDFELLECGHDRPTDKTKDSSQIYMRARRRCLICMLDAGHHPGR